MRLSLISFLSFFTVAITLGEDVVHDETLDSNIENERTISPIKERSLARTNSRNSYFQSFKIDSSKNGYGAFTEVNSPLAYSCLLYTSPSPRDAHESRMPSSA